MPRIAVLPGDGIGVDVTREAIKVLNRMCELTPLKLDLVHLDYGAEKYLKTGISLPEEAISDFRENYDAILMGALGDPRIPDMAHAKDILLGTRFKLDLYVNFRPVKLLDDRLSPLKNKGTKEIDFVVFRENTEGIYVAIGGNFKKGTPDEVAVQESLNTRKGVERIIRYAFDYARKNKLAKVTMSDKGNAMPFEGDLWMRTLNEVAENYPEIEKEHLYIDALVMQLVKNPERFDVIVTCNMFGDIITDLGGILQGGLGVAASGNINPSGTSMFEPVHGSAPKYAGANTCNPIGAILTAQMMLDHLGYRKEAGLIQEAVVRAIRSGNSTRDLGGSLGTKEVGDYICSELERTSV